MQPVLVDAGGERLLQVGAMDSAIGRAEPGAIGAAVADRVSRDPLARPAVAIDELGRLGRRRDDRVEDAEAPELAGRIGRERHRGADLRELVGLLVEIGRKAALPQGDRQSEAADSGADDRDAGLSIGHRRLPVKDRRKFGQRAGSCQSAAGRSGNRPTFRPSRPANLFAARRMQPVLKGGNR